MAKNIRNQPSYATQDPSSIASIEYNPASGAEKNVEVGPHLMPIPKVTAGVLGYTTNATVATVLPTLGKSLAIYNNAATVGSITLGEDNTITSLAVGATDANGHVGIPCAPNAWTRLSCGMQNWVIASAATLLVFMLDDDSSIKQEAAVLPGN